VVLIRFLMEGNGNCPNGGILRCLFPGEATRITLIHISSLLFMVFCMNPHSKSTATILFNEVHVAFFRQGQREITLIVIPPLLSILTAINVSKDQLLF